MKRMSILVSILLCAFIFAACSSSEVTTPTPADPDPDPKPPASGGVTEETAQDLVDFALEDSALNAAILRSNGNPSALVGYILASGLGGFGNLSSQQTDDCTTETTNGNTTTIAIDCSGVFPQGSYSYEGKLVSIQNETSARIYTDPKVEFSYVTSGETYRLTYDFDISVTTTAMGATVNADYDIETVKNGAALRYQYTTNLSYMTSAAGGALTYTGSRTLTRDGKTYSFTTRTTPNLVFDYSCNQSPVSGGIRYESGNDVVQITFTGCGTYSATLNNNPLNP